MATIAIEGSEQLKLIVTSICKFSTLIGLVHLLEMGGECSPSVFLL